MEITRGFSCARCQQRKVRCDKQKPCANCVKAQIECKVVWLQPPRRGKGSKLHKRDLIDRLKRYEAFMSQHGLDFHLIRDSKDDSAADLENNISGPDTPQGESTQSLEEEDGGHSKWAAYYKEYRITENLIRESSDDEPDRPTVHQTWDVMFNDTGGFPFVVGGSLTDITSSHPSAIQMFQLWQAYINNVNPLLKISHVPTLQAEIVGACADQGNIPKPLEALMFAIYLIAVSSMAEDEVRSTLGDSKVALLARYHQATQQALINAGFMRTTELIVLQAYLLYLLFESRCVDPRSAFCLVGIAVRIATRLGLHRDGVQLDLLPFETEQRRRVWWQIVALDKRFAEMTGSTITALSSSGTDCRLPLNLNDTDLHPLAKELPKTSSGATEMTFCLTRVELTIAVVAGGVRPNCATVNSPRGNLSSFKGPTGPASQALDGYCAYMESVYLRHCEPKIPIQNYTLLMARGWLCKLRIADFMCRGIPATELVDHERDSLFVAAVQMLEYDNIIHTTDSIRNFLWYSQLQVPMLGQVFLLKELRQRTTGELCERAWKAVCESHDRRGLIHNLHSPIHIAIAQSLLKAWDAHVEAELRVDNIVQPPNLVTLLRQRLLLGELGRLAQPFNMATDEDVPFPLLDDMDQLYSWPYDE